MGDWFPSRGDTTEMRARLFAEQKVVPSERVTFTFSGFAEGLLARRSDPASGGARLTGEEDLIFRAHEATASVRLGRFDLYAGYGRVVWGRLDELQPTDVVNPLDISRFFFEGRSEARLPVAVVRGRWYFTDDVSVEGVYVPFFRRGRFDQLQEPTSPFNLVPPFTAPDVTCLAIGCPPLVVPVESLEPPARWRNAQGGARVNATIGTVDWSLSAYRGFEAFGLYQLRLAPPAAPFTTPQPFIEERFPRFTMVGGDVETVAGQWGIRGEVAAFVHDSFQGGDGQIVEGSSIDAGIGVDRKAGEYRLSGTLLLHHERIPAAASTFDYPVRRDISFIVSADRTFAQERYQLRAFSVYNPSEGSSFLRGIFSAKLGDDVAFEASGGWFGGDGRDTIGRFGDSDFVYARVRCYW
jgi:hypothetical protein